MRSVISTRMGPTSTNVGIWAVEQKRPNKAGSDHVGNAKRPTTVLGNARLRIGRVTIVLANSGGAYAATVPKAAME